MSSESLNPRASVFLAEAIETNAAKLDRFFAGLFLVQWAYRIACAYVRPVHDDDLITAIFFGAFVASVPTMLVVWKPGHRATRHAIAVAQMLYGALLVHLTKGGDHTEVHVLFSLALLALYRDPAVLVTGAAVGVMQAFALESLQGGATLTAWIAVTSACLIIAARRGHEDYAKIAAHTAEVETMRAEIMAAMSQQIRQPMTTILGSADILLDDRQSIDPLSYVQRIRRSGQQLMDALDDVSDATKIVAAPPRPSLQALPSRRLDCAVLLVEDDLDSQKILTDHLVRGGVSVAIAPNGQVALAEVASASERGKPFDLVLMDMQMPVMDGYAATAELRKRGYGGPILALTARVMKGDRRRCMDAGCTDYLTKPIVRERLLTAVGTHALGTAATLPPPPPVTNDEPLFSANEEDVDMHELLDSFVIRLRSNAEEAEAAHAAGNTDELVHIAHRLRGAAGSFGFMPISEAAGVVEETALAGGDTRDATRAMVSLCRRARTRSFAQAA